MKNNARRCLGLAACAFVLVLNSCEVAQTECVPTDGACGPIALILYNRLLLRQFVYSLNQNASGTVFMYSVGASTLTPLSPSSVPCCNNGSILNLDPGGNFAFADDVGPDVFTYRIDRVTGQLTKIATTTLAANSNAIVVEPRGRFAYGSVNGATTIFIYSYNTNTGGLSLINTGTNAGTANTQSSIVHPSGRFLYSSNQGTADVSQFAIDDATGALTTLAAPIGSGPGNGFLCFGSNGKYLYSTNAGGPSISEFLVQSDGTLAAIGTAATTGGPLTCAVTPDSRFLLSGTSSGIEVFAINPASGLLGTGTVYNSGQHAGVAVDPGGGVVYAAHQGSNTVRMYEMNRASGALTLLDTQPAGTAPVGLALLNVYSF